MIDSKRKKLLSCSLVVLALVVIFVLCKHYHVMGGVMNWYMNLRAEYVSRRNHSHACDFPSENAGWKKFVSNPVYGGSETNSVFDPFVYQEEGNFTMILSERKQNSIIRLDSYDGIHWVYTSTLLECRPETWEHYVNRATVIKTDTLYHMWYTGQSPNVSRIGHATSKDGHSYVRDAKNPILEPTMEEEGVSVMNPCVKWNDKRRIFQMWYAAGENYEPDVLFYAESKDGISWKKHDKPVLAKLASNVWESAKVGGCDVRIMPDGTYQMYYIGYQNVDVARICFATSNDGIHWKRTHDNLILSPSKGAWDSEAVYKPSVTERNDTIFMWYNGRTANREYIGLAFKVIR